MTAPDITLADAVADAIRAAITAGDVTGIATTSVHRRHLPRVTKADTEIPLVFVSPRTRATRTGDRTRSRSRVNRPRDRILQAALVCTVRQMDGQVDEDHVDELISMAEAIDNAIQDAGTLADQSWVSSDANPIVDPERLAGGEFTAVLNITYRGHS